MAEKNTTITMSSSGGREVFAMKTERLKELSADRVNIIKQLLDKKLTGECVFVPLIDEHLFEIIAHSLFFQFETIILKSDQWRTLPKLSRDKNIIFVAFTEPGFNALVKWCRASQLNKNHYVMITCKPARAEGIKIISDACNIIDMWTNTEQQVGLKFPDCDTYHTIMTQWYTDPNNEFIDKTNRCRCGLRGACFDVKAINISASGR